jgi:catechol 2,3-dioxygenase-like lactoylglutathione lyase family enzyme
MGVQRLEHYNIRTTRFAETVKFYDDALDMKCARAPMAPEGSPATWIYDQSGIAAIHLTPVDPADPAASYTKIVKYRGGESDFAFQGSGAIDHVAFSCTGYDEIRDRLKAQEIAFIENAYPSVPLRQIFLKDPNGVTIELNFHGPMDS